jgi:hypothetical protein
MLTNAAYGWVNFEDVANTLILDLGIFVNVTFWPRRGAL